MSQTRRPTIQDVASMAKVSTATVSNVLSQKRADDDEIGLRVMEAIRLLQYRPNAAASNLRSGKTRMIGLVVPDFTNPFFGQLVAELEKLAEHSGYRLVTVSSRENSKTEQQEIIALADWQISGLIAIPSVSGEALWADFVNRRQIPAVALDRPLPQFHSVSSDNFSASHTATEQLLEFGHQHILVICASSRIGNVTQRINGIQHAIATSEHHCRMEILECGSELETAQQLISQRLDQSPMPTAIFTLFNLGTLACIGALRGRGLRMPDDLSMIGFDDYEWMQVLDPPITAISHPIPELAQTAWDSLQQLIAGEQKNTGTSTLPCTINPRASVGPAPQRLTAGAQGEISTQEDLTC